MNRMPLLILLGGGLLAGLSARSKIHSGSPLPPPTQREIVLHGISSASNQGVIDPAAKPVLDEAARMLQRDPANVIVAPCAECSTDDRSAAMLTSSVRKYLQEHGTAANRIESVGFAKR